MTSKNILSARGLIAYALVIGPLRHNLGRVALSVLGIALGVALGVAVHLVNHAAANEFSLAVQSLAGDANLVIRGPRAGFPEELYPRIARLPQVQYASPAVEIEAQLAGRPDTLKLIGIDPFRAAQVQPALIGELSGAILDLFEPDAILLSHAAADWLGLKTGDTLGIHVGTAAVDLKVIGLLPPGGYRQPLGVMDIAAAQWKLQRLGTLSRIDIRVKPGTRLERFRNDLQARLPPGVHAVTPQAEAEREASLSRAYRMNLDMLALVALFTGAFLVFSTQVLAVLRRRAQLALLRVLGLTRPALVWLLLAEGALVGTVGAALGTALGYMLAAYGLEHLGGDLGAGYFRGIIPELRAQPLALASFFVLGIMVALLGSLAPALETARSEPAQALRAGDEERSLTRLRRSGPGLLLILLGLGLSQAPPVNGLPIFGYIAIALVLIGAVLLMPGLAAASLKLLAAPRSAPAQLAVLQLQGTPGRVAISMAAILVSFSLMVSMAIMVASFRQSLDEWLARILPADLYLRSARGGETAFFTPEEQARIKQTPGIRQVHFLRSQNLLLSPERPPVILLARPIDPRAPEKTLPLLAPAVVPGPQDPPPVWVSEVVSEVYGVKTGSRIELPIAGRTVAFTVAGAWRDYGRQSGAIFVERELYIRLTGDRLANDAAIWLAPGVSAQQVQQALRARLPGAEGLEIVETGEIRAVSLRLFDRTFAVTYVLEAVAVLIGLFGVSVSFSAQVLARRGEFGMLRHIGMTRRQIGAMLGLEGTIVSCLGTGFGVALGWLVSLILIHVVNRQSFHWSMDLHLPWLPLAGLAAVLIAAASLTAVWSGRQAMGRDVIRAVREDW